MSELKYLRYVLDESGADDAEFCKKVPSGAKVTCAIRCMVNARV